MNNWKTTLFGCIAAAATAITQVDGLPASLKSACMCVTAVSGALFAFFCQDAPSSGKPLSSGLSVLALCLLTLSVVGCTMVGFKAAVSNPSFGSLSVAVGGGAIGKGAASTNTVDALVSAPSLAVASGTNTASTNTVGP
jgi:hypothetical protein